MPELTRAQLLSPGSMLSHRDRLERKIGRVMQVGIRNVAMEVKRQALTVDGLLTPAYAEEQWAMVVDNILAIEEVEDTKTVETFLLNTSLPSDIYSTARAVVTASNAQDWSRERLGRELDDALAEGQPSLVLEAAATVRPKPPEGLLWLGMDWLGLGESLTVTIATTEAGKSVLGGMLREGISKKQWVTRRDDRVRPSHVAADGQVQKFFAPFQVGGESLEHPGDLDASPAVSYNCRCVVTGVAGTPGSLLL